jgi:hypothetical protein
MKKFTYTDVRDWKVVDINGSTLMLTVRGKDGKDKNVARFDGYRSANRAAHVLGGKAVRA